MDQKITDYIPQREPIVMVSELVSATEEKAITRLNITENNIFCENGYLTESGIIENIAQTAAAMTGYNAIQNNLAVKKGFIGSVNKLKIHQLPQSNLSITTTVIIDTVVMNVHIIKGRIHQNEQLVAECEMRIFLEE